MTKNPILPRPPVIHWLNVFSLTVMMGCLSCFSYLNKHLRTPLLLQCTPFSCLFYHTDTESIYLYAGSIMHTQQEKYIYFFSPRKCQNLNHFSCWSFSFQHICTNCNSAIQHTPKVVHNAWLYGQKKHSWHKAGRKVLLFLPAHFPHLPTYQVVPL